MGTVIAENVVFVTGRELLDDMAQDLARTITAPLPRSVEIHVGMHLPRRLKPFVPPGKRDLLVGMQTEQLLDESGRELWNHRYRDKVLRLVERYDHLIDFSQTNAPIYQDLPADLRARVLIGPYIFPPKAPDLTMPPGAPLIFIGASNPRRDKALDWMERLGAAIRRVPMGTYGAALAAEVAAAAGIVNIHFDKGTYTEYPRLLKALLAGKPYVSEALAPPLVPEVHYTTLDNCLAGPDQLAMTYAKMVQLLCGTYSLQGLLDQLTAKRKAA